MMACLSDSSVLVQVRNPHYGFDFWDWLVEQNSTDELQAGGDAFAEWDQARVERFFLPPDDAVLPVFRTASDWASGRGYRPAAVATLLPPNRVLAACDRLIRLLHVRLVANARENRTRALFVPKPMSGDMRLAEVESAVKVVA